MTKELNDMIELITKLDTNTKVLEGYNSAIIGYVINSTETSIAYSVNHIIKILQLKDMSFLEATEEFDTNINRKYIGVGKPTFIYCNNKGL
tara:strand:- start:36345 stop:36617 length:273 start_codon:yes stop_codon:yes gene_type:complete